MTYFEYLCEISGKVWFGPACELVTLQILGQLVSRFATLNDAGGDFDGDESHAIPIRKTNILVKV